MSRLLINLINYFVSYPLVAFIVIIEVLAVVLLVKYIKLRKEKMEQVKKANYIKEINSLYADITNPEWLARGGKLLSYEDTKADLED